MVKNEIDIVEDWIIYHGNMFGYNNIYIVDNRSDDGTYEMCEQYKNSHGIYLTSRDDYRAKGAHMHHILRDVGRKDYQFAWPVDIDEFITYYDYNTQTLHPDRTVEYLNQLNVKNDTGIYKTDYIGSYITTPGGYDRAARQATRGYHNSYNQFAKTFYKYNKFKTTDHGNHHVHGVHESEVAYDTTSICLVHYHERSYDQIVCKTKNNCAGFGYPVDDIDTLEQLLSKNPNLPGNHHMKRLIDILSNKFDIGVHDEHVGISLQPVIKYITDTQ